MSFVMSLDADTLIDLLHKAIEKEIEDMLWQKWLVELPNMNKDNFIPFDEYKKGTKKKDVKTKMSDEEILEDAEKILKMFSR